MRKGASRRFAAQRLPVLWAAVGLGVSALLPVPAARAQGGPSLPPPPMPPSAYKPFRPKIKTTPAKPVDAVRLIQRMVKAGMSHPFLAREITLTANGKETEQWVKWEPQKGVRVENLRPTPGDLLIDNFKTQFVYSSRSKQWAQHDSLLPKPQGRIIEVLQRVSSGDLRAEWVGQDKVAGRITDIVRVGPPLGVAAPSRKFWIDRSSGLRLKMEEVSPDGRTLASSYYVFVDPSPHFSPDDFAPPPPTLLPQNGSGIAVSPSLMPRNDRRTYRSLDEAAQAGVAPLRPTYLPTGFTLRVVDAVGVKPGKKGRITQRYANGLTLLSLTQTGQPLRLAAPLGPNQTGFLTLRGTDRAYIWRDAVSGLSFALIGNLPDDQLKRIADSVR